eukprot:TRINITY_DN3084_c0_g1_i1.p1 TRINITY_DN3084_c0_g1~~TRINITY_DN3084_c0_g1_i1.p1  ORF type:complete len:983 (-),score=210.38 TRINITY_DN3084_c0_g1_i1:28-2955(-)
MIFLVFAVLLSSAAAAVQIKKHGPYSQTANDEQQQTNKFNQRSVVQMEQILFGSDASRFNVTNACHHPIEVVWSAEVGSSVYQTPVITDLFGDGTKEVVTPTFVHFFEVLDGETGHDAVGWPFTHNEIASHASVVVHDVDKDGNNDLLYTTINGELVFFRDNGEPLMGRTLKIPPLRVPKRWYEQGGNTDPINEIMYKDVMQDRHAHNRQKWMKEHPNAKFDNNGDPILEVPNKQTADVIKQEAGSSDPHLRKRQGAGPDVTTQRHEGEMLKEIKEAGEHAAEKRADAAGPQSAEVAHSQKASDRLKEVLLKEQQMLGGITRDRRKGLARRQQQDPNARTQGSHETSGTTVSTGGTGAKSGNRQLLQVPEAQADTAKDGQGADEPHAAAPQAEGGLVEDLPEDGGWADNGELDPAWYDDGQYYDSYEHDAGADGKPARAGTQGAWSDEAQATMGLIFSQVATDTSYFQHEGYDPAKDPLHSTFFDKSRYTNDPNHVWVDAHVLATPVIIDLDMDSNDDVIVAVSYYYDQDQSSPAAKVTQLAPDVDPNNYVAGGIVVMDIASGELKWSRQLDLTTNKVKFRAFVYSSPTVVDLDGDGKLEIIQSTSQGFIYVFNHNGELRRGFPKFMAEIQGQVGVADVDGDGQVDLCAVDFRSNIACFDKDGNDIWDRQISGVSAQAVSFGDVNGDGELDVVIGTSTGHVWALRGPSGEVLPHFPVRTGGAIYAPALLINLNNTEAVPVPHQNGLHIVVPSHDGHIYIIDGRAGCVDKVDIGENSYAMVLADDITNDGFMDLIAATMNGNVYVLSTNTVFHPLKTWASQTQGLNGFTAKEGYMGVMISAPSRVHRDVVGDHFKILFEIVDRRAPQRRDTHHQMYHVKITVGRSITILSKTYYRPGRYVQVVRAPQERMQTTLYITMSNEFHQVFEDSMPISFNMHFYNTIKWLVILPFAAITIVLMLNKASTHSDREEQLPGGY